MLGAAFLAGAAYFALFGGEYGYFELRRIRAERVREQTQLLEVRAEVERLQARADSLETDSATIERLARERWGMIRPGERLYRFAEQDTDSGSTR
ncbi:MAG: FtsB family cell division protein [Longimicrobiales bacterium]